MGTQKDKTKRGRPISEAPKDVHVHFRVTKKELNMLKGRAKLYADGNLSKWILHCVQEYRPRFLK